MKRIVLFVLAALLLAAGLAQTQEAPYSPGVCSWLAALIYADGTARDVTNAAFMDAGWVAEHQTDWLTWYWKVHRIWTRYFWETCTERPRYA